MQDRELDGFLQQIDAWLERGEHVLILDLAGNIGVEVRHLRRTATWLAERRSSLRQRRATVYVIGSPFMRAAISLVYQLSADPGRHHVCESRAEADALARALLDVDDVEARCA